MCGVFMVYAHNQYMTVYTTFCVICLNQRINLPGRVLRTIVCFVVHISEVFSGDGRLCICRVTHVKLHEFHADRVLSSFNIVKRFLFGGRPLRLNSSASLDTDSHRTHTQSIYQARRLEGVRWVRTHTPR